MFLNLLFCSLLFGILIHRLTLPLGFHTWCTHTGRCRFIVNDKMIFILSFTSRRVRAVKRLYSFRTRSHPPEAAIVKDKIIVFYYRIPIMAKGLLLPSGRWATIFPEATLVQRNSRTVTEL